MKTVSAWSATIPEFNGCTRRAVPPPRLRRMGARLAVAAAWLGAACAAGAQTSSFTSSTEGWTVIGDPAGPATWEATGGNPGGRLAVVDAGLGDVMYYVAPGAFLGNKAGAIGGTLRFDLQQVYSAGSSQFDNDDVVLIGAGVTLAYDTAVNPALGAWTTYAVPLTAAGWHVGTISGAAATDAQFAAVMSNLTALRIRAEFASGGTETDYLDNVALAPVPEPGTAVLGVVGLAGVFRATRKARLAR